MLARFAALAVYIDFVLAASDKEGKVVVSLGVGGGTESVAHGVPVVVPKGQLF